MLQTVATSGPGGVVGQFGVSTCSPRLSLTGSALSQYLGGVHGVADLTEADLAHADLRGANLRSAFLTGAQLVGADLTGTCLDGAYLIATNFRHARLDGTTLDHAIWDQATTWPDGRHDARGPGSRRA